ncbi:cupin domain-containing protein [Natrinema sp. CGMCC1.2065]|uniref:cupin domain-containing protein n=1 Tax=Natrinema sp. CGMCC1.2065 TaxID=3445767 RepID=UPI003F4A60D9
MQKINLDDMTPESGGQKRRSVSDPLDATDFSMNYYALEPGEEFAGRLHTHLDQEETFFVLEGEATFETKPELGAASETVTVSEGEMIRFDAGEYQQGRNEADEPLRALALGTPQESTDIRVAVPCRDCGESEYMEFTMVDGEPAMECPDCGTELEVDSSS